MRFKQIIHPLMLASLTVLTLGLPGGVQAQEFFDPEPDPFAVEDPRILQQSSSVLSMQGGMALLDEGRRATAQGNHDLAVEKLQATRQVFNQLSNFYQQLSGSFAGINSRRAAQQRQQALETAQLRDQSTYELALAHHAQGRTDLSIPLLIQIVRSQNPTTPLGRQAHEQLVRFGFILPTGDFAEVIPEVTPTLLSFDGGQNLIREAEAAVNGGNYNQAKDKFQQARQVFNQLSNFHQQLSETFSGIDRDVAQDQRQKALDSAQLRDQTTYQLALVHRAQNQPELSVPLLIQIVRSQNPTNGLGERAFQQLVELGFAD